MSTTDASTLLGLLPALYRLRDVEVAGRIGGLLTPAEDAELTALGALAQPTPAEVARRQALLDKATRGPLTALLGIVAEQIAVLEEDLEQLYDDQFIETCTPWVAPYIGDLIGYRLLHGVASKVRSRRAEVAHTIGYRRRKGTAAMLEQLARDVTGWDARVVEFFQRLATTQYMAHLRPDNVYAPALRHWAPLEAIGTAFDDIPRTVDVRRIASGRGKHNIPNVGIFLWPYEAMSLTRSPAVALDARRFLFDPLGGAVQLVTAPEREDDVTHLADPTNVPAPIGRRLLQADLAWVKADPAHRESSYYGIDKSFHIVIDGAAVAATDLEVCDLRDLAGGWAHVPSDVIAVDPVLGRLVLPGNPAAAATVEVSFRWAFGADLGAGEYDRRESFEERSGALVRVPADQPTVQAALAQLGGAGVVEIVGSGRYVEDLAIAVAPGATIELRAAADRSAPTIVVGAPIAATGGVRSTLVLNGLRVTGGGVHVGMAGGNALGALHVRHCTFAPTPSMTTDGAPVAACQPSVSVALEQFELVIQRSIVGGLETTHGSSTTITDSIVDGAGTPAFHGGAPGAVGGRLDVTAGTLFGEVHARSLWASDAIFVDRVVVERRQEGCVRFSYVHPTSLTPRRFRCQPIDAAGAFPGFRSRRFGAATYAQLGPRTPDAIRRGATDEGEMGAYHLVYAPQRESDLRTRLTEYLRVGLQAGIFHERPDRGSDR